MMSKTELMLRCVIVIKEMMIMKGYKLTKRGEVAVNLIYGVLGAILFYLTYCIMWIVWGC